MLRKLRLQISILTLFFFFFLYNYRRSSDPLRKTLIFEIKTLKPIKHDYEIFYMRFASCKILLISGIKHQKSYFVILEMFSFRGRFDMGLIFFYQEFIARRDNKTLLPQEEFMFKKPFRGSRP